MKKKGKFLILFLFVVSLVIFSYKISCKYISLDDLLSFKLNITGLGWKVTFDYNYDDGPDDKSIHIGGNGVLPSISSQDTITKPEREGYTFLGWYDYEDYTLGKQYYDKDLNTVIGVYNDSDDLVLYAGWIKQFSVTYSNRIKGFITNETVPSFVDYDGTLELEFSEDVSDSLHVLIGDTYGVLGTDYFYDTDTNKMVINNIENNIELSYGDAEVYVSSLSLGNKTNGAIENSSATYNISRMEVNVTLPALTSTITYNGILKNESGKNIRITGISASLYDNSNIEYSIDGIRVEDTISSKSTDTDFTLTLNYLSSLTELPDSTSLNLVINITWEEVINNDNTQNVIENLTGNTGDVDQLDPDLRDDTTRKTIFNTIATESGMYATKGITGDVIYYMRGNVTNNYVNFAGQMWRILQIDENGNFRLILDGAISSTGTAYKDSKSATSLSDAQTVLSYENSPVKTALDSWYATNLASYESYIVQDTKFCQDFNSSSLVSSGTSTSVDYFQSYLNVGIDKAEYSPSLVCPSEYIFTENIGLISAEEVVFAGGAFRVANNSSDSAYFLYNSSLSNNWWTLSPAYYDENLSTASVFVVKTDGSLTDWPNTSLLTNTYLLRPVITIKSSKTLVGSGTSSDPYMFEDLIPSVVTASKVSVTDLSTLEGNQYIITNINASSSPGAISSTTSNTGLYGKNTVTFSSSLDTLESSSADVFTFQNGVATSGGYLYQIVDSNGNYLHISGTSVTLSSTDTSSVLVSLAADSTYTGQVLISDTTPTYYINWYGANGVSTQFAGWNDNDLNSHLALFKID